MKPINCSGANYGGKNFSLQDILERRAIPLDDVCRKCSGFGVTFFWTAICTSAAGVCDHCWGSGQHSRPWLINEKRERQANALKAKKFREVSYATTAPPISKEPSVDPEEEHDYYERCPASCPTAALASDPRCRFYTGHTGPHETLKDTDGFCVSWGKDSDSGIADLEFRITVLERYVKDLQKSLKP